MPASTPTTSETAPVVQQPADEGEPRLVAHAPNGRLVAQRGLFRGPDPVCPDDLYAQVVFGNAVRQRQRLVVHAASEVSTDTYFGRFPASYWQRWTVVHEVDVEVTATGSGRLSVVASDAFFPFRDGVDVVAKAGAAAIIQPGGSVRDEEVIAAADEHGVAMVLTGVRHFRH